MTHIPYVVADGTITLYLDGTPSSVETDHPFYARIVQAINDKDRDLLVELIENPTGGVAEYVDGEILFGGEVLHNVLTERIMEQVSIGLSPDPMLRFLENLMKNPSKQSREELYEFLAHSYLPITEDGHFLGYKAVRSNYKDIHSGIYDNSVGKVIEMPRGDVDDDRHNHCSAGFHVGTMDYVANFGTGDSKFLLVKVDPKDAVSVPADHGAMKLRCCRYEVVQEIARGEVLKDLVYSEDGAEALESEEFEGADWDSDQDWDSEYEEWEKTVTSEEDAVEEDIQEYRALRTAWYNETYDRDQIVELAADRKLVASKEAGRRLRKDGCIALLAGMDVETFFA